MIELLVRLAISMAVVMAVMGLAARFVRRRQEAGLGGAGFSGRGRGAGLRGTAGLRGSGGFKGSRGFGSSQGVGGSTGANGSGSALPGEGSPGGLGVGGPASGPAGGPNTLATKLGSLLGAPKPRRARPVPPFEVVYRRALSKGAAVAVIEATGKQFLLGVTEQSVTLLTELPRATDATPLDADGAATTSVPTAPTVPIAPTVPTATSGPMATSGTRAATRAGASEISDLEVWDEFDDWQQADRMPASSPDASTLERQNAWKLTLDSLRERTIRR